MQLIELVSRQSIIREMEPEELVREFHTLAIDRWEAEKEFNWWNILELIYTVKTQYKQLTGTEIKL